MSLTANLGLEDHNAGTVNIGGIINGNWLRLDEVFGPGLGSGDPAYNLFQAINQTRRTLTAPAYSASLAISMTSGPIVRLAITGNLTLSFTDKAAGRSLWLVIEADSTARTITWPSGVGWAGQAQVSVAANAIAIIFVAAMSTTDASLRLASIGQPAGTGTTYAAAVAAMLPIAYWKLDETSGTSMADSSGNSHAGTLGGSGTTLNSQPVIKGNTGKAPNFNGSGYVTAAHASLNFTPGTNPFSVSAWFRTTSSAVGVILSKTGGGTDRNFQIFTTSSSQNIAVYAGGGNNSFAAPRVLTDNIWHHVAVTLSPTVGTLYLDGLVISTFTPGTQAEDAVDWMIAGRRSGGLNTNTGTSNLFTGDVAHVALFNRALTMAEVLRLGTNSDLA